MAQKQIERSSRIGKVPVDKIVVDHRVQREQLNPTKINHFVANFNADALGVVILSQRNNGTFIALDGWHRTETCKLVPEAPAELDAIIWTGLSLADEARLFQDYNNRTTLRATDIFTAQVTEGAEEATLIAAAVAKYGLPIGRNGFAAVANARKIVRRYGLPLFEQTLEVIDKAFTLDNYSSDYRMLGGIAEMLHHYAGDLEVNAFIKRLSEHVDVGETPEERGRAGVAAIIKKAKAYHDATHPGGFEISMCVTLVPIYNKGRKEGGRLAPYERRTGGAKVNAAVEA